MKSSVFYRFIYSLTIVFFGLMALTPPVNAQSSQPFLVYEFDQSTLTANGWNEPTGGYSGRPAGTADLVTFPPGTLVSSQDQKGLAILVKPNEVAFLYTLAPVDTSGSPVLLRLTVRADSPNAAVALGTLRGNLNDGTLVDGSIATHVPASAASFVYKERRIVLIYEPDQSNIITPVIQVAATGQTGNVTVFIDKLEILKLDANEFGAETSVSKPTPTPTMGSWGWIHFYGFVTAFESKQNISGARIYVDIPNSQEDRSVLSDANGFYSIEIYGYLFNTYKIVAEAPGFLRSEIQSAYDSAHVWQKELNIELVSISNKTPTIPTLPSPTNTFITIPPTASPIITFTPTPFPQITHTPALDSQIITVRLPNLPADAKPLEMMLIPAGTYIMGSSDLGEGDRPKHRVTISKPFYLGKYEITQAQWQAMMNFNPSAYFDSLYGDLYGHFGVGPNYPVFNVDWGNCREFADKLNQLGLVQGTFRLPTEAEWEYACRAGTTTKFYWGDDDNKNTINSYAWYSENSFDPTNTIHQLHEVGLKLPNAWGLFDICGNVREWCGDYGVLGYTTEDQTDPFQISDDVYRMTRGGSCEYGSGILQSACRFMWKGDQNHDIGLRIALAPV